MGPTHAVRTGTSPLTQRELIAEYFMEHRVQVLELAAFLDRLDRARDAPWTHATLTLIERHPATKAAELAEQTQRELHAFKRDVRKLKELGLTESLERGYRVSPRGRTVLARARA